MFQALTGGRRQAGIAASPGQWLAAWEWGLGQGLRGSRAEKDAGEMEQHRHKGDMRAGPCVMDMRRGQTEKDSNTLFHKATQSPNADERCPDLLLNWLQ